MKLAKENSQPNCTLMGIYGQGGTTPFRGGESEALKRLRESIANKVKIVMVLF